MMRLDTSLTGGHTRSGELENRQLEFVLLGIGFGPADFRNMPLCVEVCARTLDCVLGCRHVPYAIQASEAY